jgi:hypothetical protein
VEIVENELIRRITEEKTAAEKLITINSNTSSYWFGRLTLATELLKLYKEGKKMNIELDE